MANSELRKTLLPCDMESPFVFVSYCSQNKDVVWNDVANLQERGVNLWVDEPNLDKRKPSWKEDALRAIDNFNCELLIFYLSKESLVSEACLNELKETFSEAALATHNMQTVNVIVVEVEPVDNIVDYMDQTYREIAVLPVTSDEKGRRSTVLTGFRQLFQSNEKVRIRSKSSYSVADEYYEEFESQFSFCTRLVTMSVAQQYRHAIDCIVLGRYNWATRLLYMGAKLQYLPALLMLAHLINTQKCIGLISETSMSMWSQAEEYYPSSNWKGTAKSYTINKYYSEALAYLVACGEYLKDVPSFLAAGQLWLGKGSLEESLSALRSAAQLGDPRAEPLLSKFKSLSQSELDKVRYKDESRL